MQDQGLRHPRPPVATAGCRAFTAELRSMAAQLSSRFPTEAGRFDAVLQRLLAGRGAAQSYYRWRQQQERTASFYEAPGGQRDPRTPAEWRQRADAFRQRAGEVLRRSHARYPLPPGRYQQLRQVLAYEWGHVLLSLPFIYEYEQPRPLRVVRPLPESYYDFGRELPLPQDSLLAYRAYRTYAAEYYPLYQQRRARQRLTFAENISRQFVLSYDSVVTWAPGATQHLALATQLWFLLKLGAEADATSRLADFQRRNSRHPLHASLARLAAARQRTAPGQPLPPFRLLNEAGQPADLASLCGKVVYLDFWASWCKPCRAEQPALQALRRHFAGRAEVAPLAALASAPAASRWARRWAGVAPLSMDAASRRCHPVRQVATMQASAAAKPCQR